MSRVIGYTYEADTHCVACTKDRYEKGGFKIQVSTWEIDKGDEPDENGVAYGATDREGNLVHPIFTTSELPYDDEGNALAETCGTCHGIIRAP